MIPPTTGVGLLMPLPENLYLDREVQALLLKSAHPIVIDQALLGATLTRLAELASWVRESMQEIAKHRHEPLPFSSLLLEELERLCARNK